MDIAKILAMSDEEQWYWLTEKADEYWPEEEVFIGTRDKYMADLAFRLRNEAYKLDDIGCLLSGGMDEVIINSDYTLTESNVVDVRESQDFMLCFAQPIHWILAAIKAKEKHNEQR